MIAAWRVCADCPTRFGLTPRQCNSGLVAERTRCAPCRDARRRRMAAVRAHHFRLRRRNAGSAPVHTTSTSERLCDERNAA